MEVRHPTKGRITLRAWLKAHKIKQRELAELLGVQYPQVVCWSAGTMRPAFPDREALERLTGIPIIDWLNEEELDARVSKFDRIDRLAKTKGREVSFLESLALRM